MERINRKNTKDLKIFKLSNTSFFKLIEVTEQEINDIFKHKPYSKKHINGKRISIPCKKLLILQKKIARLLKENTYVHSSVYSYRKGSSILRCIDRHKYAINMLHVDVKNFFEAILQSEVEAYFQNIFYMKKDDFYKKMVSDFDVNKSSIDNCFMNEKSNIQSDDYIGLSSYDIKLIGKICCNEGRLPIGAASSPVLSNIVLINMDKRINSFATERGFRYTRYADDIIISCHSKPPVKSLGASRYERAGLHSYNLRKFLPILIDLLRYYGFKINYKKVKYMRNIYNKKIFNININNRGERTVSRKYKRCVRAARHQLKLHKENAKKGDGLLNYRENINEGSIVGKEAWIKHVDNRMKSKFRFSKQSNTESDVISF